MTATPAPPAGAPAGLLALLDRLGTLAAKAKLRPWYIEPVEACDGNACIKHAHFDVYRNEARYESTRAEPGITEGALTMHPVNVGCFLGDAADLEFLIACANALPALLTAARRGAETMQQQKQDQG